MYNYYKDIVWGGWKRRRNNIISFCLYKKSDLSNFPQILFVFSFFYLFLSVSFFLLCLSVSLSLSLSLSLFVSLSLSLSVFLSPSLSFFLFHYMRNLPVGAKRTHLVRIMGRVLRVEKSPCEKKKV